MNADGKLTKERIKNSMKYVKKKEAAIGTAYSLGRLIEYLLPDNIDEEALAQYNSYFLRILSSRLNPSVSQDLSQLKTVIQKKLLRAPGSHTESNAKNHRFSELFHILSHSKLNNKWGILYALYSIGESTSNNFSQNMPLKSIYHSYIVPSLSGTPQRHDEPMEMETEEHESQNRAVCKHHIKSKLVEKKLNSEISIVRDLLYILQGVDGANISYSILDDAYNISANLMVNISIRERIFQICELGWLFKRVNEYIHRNKDSSYGGLVLQSFCFALSAELTEYYRFITILDNQNKAETEDASESLTIAKLYLWVQEPFERMKWLALMIDAVENVKGGALASTLHSYSIMGNQVKLVIHRLLKEVCVPILNMIKIWMMEGVLEDTFHEFFVTSDSKVSDERLWRDKYKLEIEMIPNFLSENIAHKILLTGKAVNFIRKCCNCPRYEITQRTRNLIKELRVQTMLNDLNSFQELVDEAYVLANKDLIDVLFNKYRLKEHCESIRKYILLGQGDFAQNLMDLISGELDKSAEEMFHHNLITIVDSAIRGSNAQYDDMEFLQCIDLKLLQKSIGDKGWDIFSLYYKVGPPLNTIITQDLMKNYLRIFNFLWRLKRVDSSLSSTWVENMSSKSKFRNLPEVRIVFHKSNILRHEIIRFLSSFHNYMMVEVLQTEWNAFTESIVKCVDLDQLRQKHEEMVNKIIDKCLLTEKSLPLYRTLLKIFDLILRFRYNQDVLYTTALDEFHRKITIAGNRRYREMLGENYDKNESLQEFEAQSKFSPEACLQIENICAEFHQLFNKFRQELSQRPEENLKMLSFQVDFNEFYKKQNDEQSLFFKPFNKRQDSSSDDGDFEDVRDFDLEPQEEKKQELIKPRSVFNENIINERHTFKNYSNPQFQPELKQARKPENENENEILKTGFNISENQNQTDNDIEKTSKGKNLFSIQEEDKGNDSD